MCVLLGDFLRLSMRLGQKERIRLGEELTLTRGFLGIEKARFGDRLRIEEEIAENTLDCRVPPLILQPLAENAVRHGIAHLVDGGKIILKAARSGNALQLSVENERDPDARIQPGEGTGLANARRRIEGSFRGRTTFEARGEGDWFRVRITLPVEEGEAAKRASPPDTGEAAMTEEARKPERGTMLPPPAYGGER